MFKSPKLYLVLILFVLVVFSVLGTSDILNLKERFFVEGYTNATSVNFTDAEGNTYYVARGPEGNVVYITIDSDGNATIYRIVEENTAGAITVTDSDGKTYFIAEGPKGNVVYGNVDTDGTASVHKKDNNNHPVGAIIVTDSEGNEYFIAEGPRGNVVTGEITNNNNNNNYDYNSEYSIYYPYSDSSIVVTNEIPPNQYNYIKKTQIVPPVCPACPYPPPLANNLDSNGQPVGLTNENYPQPENGTNSSSYTPNLDQMVEQIKKEKCPPCPACARCPEPSFECKKVPNYNSPGADNYLPMPVLNDFSNF